MHTAVYEFDGIVAKFFQRFAGFFFFCCIFSIQVLHIAHRTVGNKESGKKSLTRKKMDRKKVKEMVVRELWKPQSIRFFEAVGKKVIHHQAI